LSNTTYEELIQPLGEYLLDSSTHTLRFGDVQKEFSNNNRNMKTSCENVSKVKHNKQRYQPVGHAQRWLLFVTVLQGDSQQIDNNGVFRVWKFKSTWFIL